MDNFCQYQKNQAAQTTSNKKAMFGQREGITSIQLLNGATGRNCTWNCKYNAPITKATIYCYIKGYLNKYHIKN